MAGAAPFYCRPCFVHCTSALDMQSHLRGKKHASVVSGARHKSKKGIAAMVAVCRPPSAPVVPLREMTLQDYLDASGSGEPAIGLEYVCERWSGTPTPMYMCKLCGCHTLALDMFNHIMGNKHRQAYLTRHHVKMAWIKDTGPDQHSRVKELAQEVEKKYGRQQIRVISVDSGEEGKRKHDGDHTEPSKSQQRDVTSSERDAQPAPASPKSFSLISTKTFSLIPSKRFPMKPSKWFPLRSSSTFPSRPSKRRTVRPPSRPITRSPMRPSKRSTSRSTSRSSKRYTSRRSKRSTSRSPLRRSKRSTSRSSTRSPSRRSKRSTSSSSSRSSTTSSSSSSTGSHSDSSTTSSSSSTTASSGQAHIVPSQELQKPQAQSKQNKNKLDDFRSNQEFFEYLKEFEISCEDDAVFLVKVTQMFMQLLFEYQLKNKEYQLKSMESPEAAVSPRDSYSTQETNTASSTGQTMYTEYPPKTISGQQPPVSTATTYREDANRSVITEYPPKTMSGQQPPVPTTTMYRAGARRSVITEYPPKTMSGQQPPVPTATTYWEDANRSVITDYPLQSMSSQQPPVPTASTYWANARRSVIPEYPPQSMFGQQPPVSTALTCWADANTSVMSTRPVSESIHVGPSSKEIVPTLHSAHAVQEQSHLENTMDNPESDYRCYLCGALDHHVRDCPTSAYAGLGPVPMIQQRTGIPRRLMGVEDPKTLTDIGASTMLPIDRTPRTPCSEPPNTTTQLAKANASDEDKIIGASVRQSGYTNDYMKKTGSNLFITCQYCGKQGHHKFQCPFIGTANLADADASEEDKIRAMMCQSAHEYDPVNYQKLKQKGTLPSRYTCYRCNKPGHHIRNCPSNADTIRMKNSTGIPRSFMVKVSDPNMKGAKRTGYGTYAIPAIDAAVYAMEKPEDPAPSTADDKPTPAKHRIIAAGIMSSHGPNLPPQ